MKASTRFIDTKGWGPFVEIKFNIFVVFCKRGLLSVDVWFKFDTSTSTMASFKDLLRNFKANPLIFLHVEKYFSSVKSWYHKSLLEIFSSSDFMLKAFKHKEIYSDAILFLSSAISSLGPDLQFIKSSRDVFLSSIETSALKLNALLQRVSHCGQGSNLRAIDSKTSLRNLAYFGKRLSTKALNVCSSYPYFVPLRVTRPRSHARS